MNEETAVLTETEFETLVDAPVLPEEQEETDVRKIPQRRPPKEGTCRRCGQDKPVNRMMLCYPCWVKTELEAHGWREGMPHPDWCRCEGLGAHTRRSDGN